MLRIRTTAQFEADLRRMARAGRDGQTFGEVVRMLAHEEPIPAEYRDHELSGRWAGVRDIHVEPDWLLLYQPQDRDLLLIRSGTHDDLFLRA